MIDVTQVLTNLDGEPLVTGANPDPQAPATLRFLAVAALTNILRGDENLPGQKKFEMAQLARKIHEEDEVALTAEEIAMLKDRIGRGYSGVFVLRSWEILDESLRPKEAEAK